MGRVTSISRSSCCCDFCYTLCHDLFLLSACKQLVMSGICCAVQELIRSGADDVKSKALQTAGNLAFCQDNRALILQADGFRDIMTRLADQAAVVKQETRMSAIRALAILGQLRYICRAACTPAKLLFQQQWTCLKANRAAVVFGGLLSSFAHKADKTPSQLATNAAQKVISVWALQHCICHCHSCLARHAWTG